MSVVTWFITSTVLVRENAACDMTTAVAEQRSRGDGGRDIYGEAEGVIVIGGRGAGGAMSGSSREASTSSSLSSPSLLSGTAMREGLSGRELDGLALSTSAPSRDLSSSPLHERTSSAVRTFAPPLLGPTKSAGVDSSARRPESIRPSSMILTRRYASSALPSTISDSSSASSSSSSSSSSSAVSSCVREDFTSRYARGGRMSRDSRSLRRRSRISFACRCFVVSSVALMARRERLEISRSAIYVHRRT